MTTWYVPESEQITVKQGDLLGIYYGSAPRHDIGYFRSVLFMNDI